MICKRICAENFRNIKSCDVNFSEGVNILIGDNAQGKTNLLEAIYFTALGKSFRPAKEAELIMFGEDAACLKNSFCDSVRDQNISVRLFSGKARKMVEHNGIKIARMSELVGAFRVVLFCPEHLSLIHGGPELRRNYLNVALSQLRPVYLRSLQRYNQILKERNSLIRKAGDDIKTFNSTIDFWSEQLAHEAAVISLARAEYVKKADDLVNEIFEDMSSCFQSSENADRKEIPKLKYVSSVVKDDNDADLLSDLTAAQNKYMELLSTRHEREISAGVTLYGIHRDDIRIDLDGRPARLFGSQGQQRSLALAMKLAEGRISAKEFGMDHPVFLFDDVLSELDQHRRAYLMRQMNDQQVIMTTCELDENRIYGHDINIVRVERGRYSN